MPVTFFDITRQNSRVKEELGGAMAAVANSGRYILGENVAALEKEVAVYCGAKFAVGVSSGTEALHLALRAGGVTAGDEVITSPFTFVATAEAIAYCGAHPVFADIDPETFNLDPAAVKAKITKKTKALLPVHLFGLACQMAELSRFGLPIIEDCAQAIGAEFGGRKVGSFGRAGCFSFFPTKSLGCFGDGGMVTTNDEKIAGDLRVLRGHGSRRTYHYDIIGYNSRLDELQAAILRVKLPHLDNYLEKRRHNAGLYRKLLQDLKQVVLPSELDNSRHTYNQFTLRVPTGRDQLFEFLKSKGIGAMVYYPLSLHLQAAFKELGHKVGDFPRSERAQAEVLSLPIFPELLEEEITTVCSALHEFYRQ